MGIRRQGSSSFLTSRLSSFTSCISPFREAFANPTGNEFIDKSTGENSSICQSVGDIVDHIGYSCF